MASLDQVSIVILLGAALVMAGILSSLLALRFGAPLLLVFLVIGILAALLGFTTIAGASFAIAKFLAALFLILFLVFLVIGLTAAKKIID